MPGDSGGYVDFFLQQYTIFILPTRKSQGKVSDDSTIPEAKATSERDQSNSFYLNEGRCAER